MTMNAYRIKCRQILLHSLIRLLDQYKIRVQTSSCTEYHYVAYTRLRESEFRSNATEIYIAHQLKSALQMRNCISYQNCFAKQRRFEIGPSRNRSNTNLLYRPTTLSFTIRPIITYLRFNCRLDFVCIGF